MNRVHRLELGEVVLPDSHPRSADGTCPIFCFAIEHADGLVVVDTGPKEGHPVIDQLYSPKVISIVDALHHVSIDERDVTAIVNTHLHFDHCGQNDVLPGVPIWVTADEVKAATAEFYTVPEWAAIAESQQRLSTDGEEVAPGVRLLHTPGHTPGHQSVEVDTALGLVLIAGQACYSCAEFVTAQPAEADAHDAAWIHAAAESARRLKALDPVEAHLSHDKVIYRR